MKRTSRWFIAGLAVLLAAGAAYLLLARPRVAELVGIAASGGERVLRDPMRAPGNGPRVLIIALDGVGDDELLDAIRSGRAPHISSLLGPEQEGRTFGRAYAVPDVLSILPSTTLAAWSSLFTGATAAHTGVPGNEWFAREEMRYYAPAPVSVEGYEHAVQSYTDDLVGGALRVPTLFEQADVRAYVSLSHIHRGADLLVIPSADALADLVAAAFEGLSDETRAVGQEGFVALDENAVDNLVDAIGRHGLPDLQVVYFPGIDLFTHVAEQPLEAQRGYVADVIDPAVGRLLQLYRDAGVMDDTWVLFVADHGHTPVLNDERHALGAEGEDDPVALLEQVGFRVRARKLELEDDEHDFQATVAYQGAFAYLYLADRSTCPTAGMRCDWMKAPRLEEDVIPVLRALDAANRGGIGVPALRGTLDLVFARPPVPPGEDALPFQVWDGTGLVDVGEWLQANPRPDLLDFERRLRGLGAGPFGHRAGDILLLARSGAVRPIEDRFYFSSRYHSWHGSPDAQDSRIPLLVAHGRHDGSAIRQRVHDAVGARPNQEDITALLLDLLRTPGP